MSEKAVTVDGLKKEVRRYATFYADYRAEKGFERQADNFAELDKLDAMIDALAALAAPPVPGDADARRLTDVPPMLGEPITDSASLDRAIARLEKKAPAPILTLNGYQLRSALEFIAPDGDADQLESEVCIQHGGGMAGSDGEIVPVGLYCWMDEYPEEGSIFLSEGPGETQP